MMMMMTMVAELECDVMMHCGAGNHQVPVIEGAVHQRSAPECWPLTRVVITHQRAGNTSRGNNLFPQWSQPAQIGGSHSCTIQRKFVGSHFSDLRYIFS